MSDMQEFSAGNAEATNQGFDPMTTLPGYEGMRVEMIESTIKNLKAVDETMDEKTYPLGEIPQDRLVDPYALLPLNSERLIGSVNVIETTLSELGHLVEQVVGDIQKHQKRITFWEDRIEKNKAQIKKNELVIKQNSIDIIYDKKNRDYWTGRAEEVEMDYSQAEAAGRCQNWAWLIKKYGLKNTNGTEINAEIHCVEELCNGGMRNLVAEYRASSGKYEISKKAREADNRRLISENSQSIKNNELLQSYISTNYTIEIEPLQDGVLLLKELGVKLKALSQEDQSTYGQMRAWAESFLNDFIKANSKIAQHIVTHFRRLTSIPLPPENS